MIKKLLAFFAAMTVFAAFAAVDVNKATEAELDAVKGIGPVTTKLIVSERKKGEFKSWADFVSRVKGVGDTSAAKFSAQGLTVGGAAYTGAGAAEAKAKAAEKKTEKPIAEKAKDVAVATKDAAKGAAVATKNAVVETAKDIKAAVVTKTEKNDAKPATVVNADAKASASKPAGSAAVAASAAKK